VRQVALPVRFAIFWFLVSAEEYRLQEASHAASEIQFIRSPTKPSAI
jgi:hypothetical protein